MSVQPEDSDAVAARVAHNIRTLLGNRGYNQTDLARVLHMDTGGVTKRMGGSVPWKLHELVEVANFLTCEVGHLSGPTSDLPLDEAPLVPRGGHSPRPAPSPRRRRKDPHVTRRYRHGHSQLPLVALVRSDSSAA